MKPSIRQLAHELAEQTDQELASLTQFELIAQGAQAGVYMSTDPALGRESTPREQYEAPRVMKIALGDAAILGYVRDTIGMTDPIEQKRKVRELMTDQYVTYHHVLSVSTADSHMDERFGHPRAVMLGLSWYLHSAEDRHSMGVNYTQDYLPTAAKVFDRLDLGQAAHRKLGRSLIRQYVDFQVEDLIPYGLFDTSYKLLDNYAVDRSFTLRNIDFSEHCRTVQLVENSVRSREWEQLPTRQESTQLPGYFQEYLSDQLRKRLTPDQLKRWGAAKPPHPELLPLAKFIDFRAMGDWVNYLDANAPKNQAVFSAR